MTSREVLDLLHAKSGKEISYSELRKRMKKLGIHLSMRQVDGMEVRAYLSKSDIHAIANEFGIDLYVSEPRKPSTDQPAKPSDKGSDNRKTEKREVVHVPTKKPHDGKTTRKLADR